MTPCEVRGACRFMQWVPQPYDYSKGGAYYMLTCCDCGKTGDESFMPSTMQVLYVVDGLKLSMTQSNYGADQKAERRVEAARERLAQAQNEFERAKEEFHTANQVLDALRRLADLKR